jgi:NAD(P)-dependent dehydrogenase (short-subunit alcohol dehydrogenase family)
VRPDRGDWLGLRDQVCVVTGAASGMGREIALRFAAAGAKVVALDRDANGCADTADEVTRQGGTALALPCDVTDPDRVAVVATEVLATLGRCDVLINNAGILQSGDLETLTLRAWNAVMQVNLSGYLLCAQEFGADMLKRGRGALVHVASIAASHPQAFSGAYSASKAGVVMLSRQIAFEWGPHGVRSNAISPGLVRTPMSEAFYQAPGVVERREAVIPLRRIGKPDDIADVALFLASERARYVTGQEIIVDGGFAQTLMSHVPRPGFG